MNRDLVYDPQHPCRRDNPHPQCPLGGRAHYWLASCPGDMTWVRDYATLGDCNTLMALSHELHAAIRARMAVLVLADAAGCMPAA